jgi:hypothetical protein
MSQRPKSNGDGAARRGFRASLRESSARVVVAILSVPLTVLLAVGALHYIARSGSAAIVTGARRGFRRPARMLEGRWSLEARRPTGSWSHAGRRRPLLVYVHLYKVSRPDEVYGTWSSGPTEGAPSGLDPIAVGEWSRQHGLLTVRVANDGQFEGASDPQPGTGGPQFQMSGTVVANAVSGALYGALENGRPLHLEFTGRRLTDY